MKIKCSKFDLCIDKSGFSLKTNSFKLQVIFSDVLAIIGIISSIVASVHTIM